MYKSTIFKNCQLLTFNLCSRLFSDTYLVMHACMHTLLHPYFLWTHNGKELPQIVPEYPEIHQMQHAHNCCLLLEK